MGFFSNDIVMDVGVLPVEPFRKAKYKTVFSELFLSEVKNIFWLIKYPFHNKVCWTNKAMHEATFRVGISDKNSLPRSNLLRISFKIQSTKQSI